jgi:Zn-dependent peptidase ImmA (M78 family)
MKIPKKVMGLGGMITVKRIPKLKFKGEKVAGLWRSYERTIEINSSLPVREQRHTLYHELTHAALDDSGLHYTMSKDSQEVLCDLMATSRLRSEESK